MKQRNTVENQKAGHTKTGRENPEQGLVKSTVGTPDESQFNDKNCKNRQEEAGGVGGGGVVGGQSSGDLSTD